MGVQINMNKAEPPEPIRHIKKAGKGEFVLRCGACGCTQFVVHVMPANGSPKAFVTALICANRKCMKHRNVDERGLLAGDGKMEFNPKRFNGAELKMPEIYGDIK